MTLALTQLPFLQQIAAETDISELREESEANNVEDKNFALGMRKMEYKYQLVLLSNRELAKMERMKQGDYQSILDNMFEIHVLMDHFY